MDILGGKSKVRKGGQKNRKFFRQARRPAKKRYNHEVRWFKNKLRKLKKHIKNHQNDKVAIKALREAT